jgi:tRNA pseudouridine13 synthase
MGEEFAVQFRQFLENPEDKDAVLTVPADKDQRIKLYRLLENNLETKLYSRGKDGNMIIKWPTSTEYQEGIQFDRQKKRLITFFRIY